jgi:uncharacterized caspase-like protein
MRIRFYAALAALLFFGPSAAFAELGSGTRWAVCIGIGDYEDPDLTDLPHAANDARGLARALERHGGFDRVRVLTDDQGPTAYPSRKNILSVLEQVLPEVDSGDTLLVFFSGHGVNDPGGRSFLLPADARVRNIPRTAVPLADVQSFLARSGAEQRILFLDAARKEIWRNGPRLSAVYPDRYMRDQVSAAFYAAKKGTFSHNRRGAPHGVFGGALIAGVQGEADRDVAGDGDGVVSLMELGAYVEEKVTSWSMETGLPQSTYTRTFESGAARLALARTGEETEERVLAAARPEPRTSAAEEPTAKEPSKIIRVVPPEREDAPEPPETPAPKGAEEGIVVGAQAPGIDEVEEEREEPPKPAVAPVEPEAPPAVPPSPPARPEPEEEAGVLVGSQAPSIDEVGEPVTPPGSRKTPEEPPEASPVPPEGERAFEYEAGERDREERVLAGEEAPSVASVPEVGPGELKPETAPPAPPPEPVSLRRQPRDLSEEGVKILLEEHGFYATCWTYNGEFCNPNGEFENSYQDNGDGTVTDRRTGLMWQKDGSPGVVDWNEAGAYVETLNRDRFAGHAGWRLPTVEELASLMERSWLNDDLFLAPVFSPALKYCWSADTKGVERAWKGNFHLGFFLDFPMSDLSGVRAVRSVR